jgi:hypothetical protein
MKVLNKTKKVKVLGYPFAGGQGKSGVELTPSWLQDQSWFKNMASQSNGLVEYEAIKVSDQTNNLNKKDQVSDTIPKNFKNVYDSSFEL